MKDLSDLFEHMVRDIYYAENQILKHLPKMAEKASSGALSDAFSEHYEETGGHKENLEKVFEELGWDAKGVECQAIDGILDEGKEIMEECEDDEACDAGMLAAAQAVEHYEITRYGTLVAWAQQLNKPKKVVDLLQANLDQEYEADRKLSAIAEGSLNKKAA